MNTPDIQLPDVEATDLIDESDPESARKFNIALNIVFCLVAITAIYACYKVCTAPVEWGFKIDWNCFHSEITYGTCCVIGFFLQFIVKGGWMHTTTEEYIGYKDPITGKVEKWEKNDDVLTFLFNSLLWPLIMHLMLIPMAYGAAIWYSIAGIIALVGKLTPYIISLLLIGLCAWIYNVVRGKTESGKRYIWLIMSGLFCISVCGATCLAMGANFEESTTEQATVNHVIVNSNNVNLRLGPGTNYDKFSSTVSAGQELQLLGEDGEWYKVMFGGNELWIHSRFVDIPLPDNAYIEEIGCETDEVIEETASNSQTIEEETIIEQEPVAETSVRSETDDTNASETTVEEAPQPTNTGSQASNQEQIYTAAETQPSFAGGEAALFKWLANNINYPPMAVENKIQGRVVVQFVVNSDGTIGDAKVIRGVNQDLDNEALRVVKAMPKWNAATMSGHPVSCRYTLPISFKLH